MKKLVVSVELGFEDIGSDSNINSAQLELRNGLKELVFETTKDYLNITSFKIDEIIISDNGADNSD